MSAGYYAVDDYGLVLNDEAMKLLARQLCENFKEEDFDNDDYLYKEEVIEKLSLERIMDFNGEVIAIQDDGYSDYFNTENFSGDEIYYVGTKKVPSLFKAVYKDIDEMINESRETVGQYLPEDFNYRDNIKHIAGTYYA